MNSSDASIAEILASVFTAIGTVAVAVAAIWGDWIKSKWFGSKLELTRVERWDLNIGNDGRRQIYCHLQVKRRWSPAKSVRVVVEGLGKRGPDGTFFPKYLVVPLQLTWAFPRALRKKAKVALVSGANRRQQLMKSALHGSVKPPNVRVLPLHDLFEIIAGKVWWSTACITQGELREGVLSGECGERDAPSLPNTVARLVRVVPEQAAYLSPPTKNGANSSSRVSATAAE